MGSEMCIRDSHRITSYFQPIGASNTVNTDSSDTRDDNDSVTSDSAPEYSSYTPNIGTNILCWNVEGLINRLACMEVSDFLLKYDIICLCETFLIQSFDSNLKFPNYVCIQKPAIDLGRGGRASGGVLILYKKEIANFISEIDNPSDSFVSLRIRKELWNVEKDVLMFCSYVHPTDSRYYQTKDFECDLEELEEFMYDWIDQQGISPHWLILGDLNSRCGVWSLPHDDSDGDSDDSENDTPFERNSNDTTINNFGRNLIEFCLGFNLTPVHGLIVKNFDKGYTFISEQGDSVIDHVLCSPILLEKVKSFKILSRIESPHLPLAVTVGSQEGTTDHKQKRSYLNKYVYNVDFLDDFRARLGSTESRMKLDLVTSCDDDIDNQIKLLHDSVIEAGISMKKTIVYGGTPPNKNKWYDKECLNLKKLTKKALTKVRRNNKYSNLEKFHKLKKAYHEHRKSYKTLLREKKNKFRRDLFSSLIVNMNDSKAFWGVIKNMRPKVMKMPNITIKQWEEHFRDVLNPDGAPPAVAVFSDENEVNVGVEVEQLDSDFTIEEVKTALSKLKSGKAAGIDMIPPDFFKVASDILLPYLVHIFNNIYNKAYFPRAWSQATIIPIFKKGDSNNPSNYRGISLLSLSSKIFMSILTTRLYNLAELRGWICYEQAGFRRGYATTDHIFTLYQIISNCLYGDHRSKLYVAFIDYSKAFDTVNRNKLWEVLADLGVSTKFLNMLKAIYSRVQGCVRHGAHTSDVFDCPLGLRQGCVLSPILFSLLINVVANEINRHGRQGYQLMPGTQEIKILLFADDLGLINLTPAGLQNSLRILERVSEDLGLTVNLNKTKIMVYRKGGFLGQREKWYFNQQEIGVVNSYKYLGYTLTTKLSRELALSEYIGKAKRKIFQLLKIFKILGHQTPQVFFKLLEAQIYPQILYASEIWGPQAFRSVEGVHMLAAKKYLGVKVKTPNLLLYGELGRHPIHIESQTRAVNYWLKILSMDEDRLPKLAYLRELRQLNKTQNWATNIKSILDQTGFSEVWLSQGAIMPPAFKKQLKQRLIDIFWQDWSSACSGSNRCITYRALKSTVGKEPYIDVLDIARYRHAFARMRIGASSLNVNKLYVDQIPDVDCPVCGLQETELHFLIFCPLYDLLRTKYIGKYMTDNNILQLKYWLNTTDVNKMKDVASFVFHGLRARQDFIYALNG